MKPRISIITINYNNLVGLKKTIESVVNQTWQEFEYLVIDGGSTDGSVAYLEHNKDLFAYWISESDKGVYHAMNKGIAKASGEYLLFLNSGDHLYNKRVLEYNHKFISEKDIIYFNLEVIESAKKYIKEYPDILSFSYFVEDTLPHPATFINKMAFERTNLYKEEFKIVSDWKFFIDGVCKFNLSYKRINAVLSTFYIGGMSSDPINRSVKFNEIQQVLNNDYLPYIQDLEDVLVHKLLVSNFRRSRIIKLLVKLGFLNKF